MLCYVFVMVSHNLLVCHMKINLPPSRMRVLQKKDSSENLTYLSQYRTAITIAWCMARRQSVCVKRKNNTDENLTKFFFSFPIIHLYKDTREKVQIIS